MPPQATFKDLFLLKLQMSGTSKEASRGSQLSSTLHPDPPFITVELLHVLCSHIPTYRIHNHDEMAVLYDPQLTIQPIGT